MHEMGDIHVHALYGRGINGSYIIKLICAHVHVHTFRNEVILFSIVLGSTSISNNKIM